MKSDICHLQQSVSKPTLQQPPPFFLRSASAALQPLECVRIKLQLNQSLTHSLNLSAFRLRYECVDLRVLLPLSLSRNCHRQTCTHVPVDIVTEDHFGGLLKYTLSMILECQKELRIRHYAPEVVMKTPEEGAAEPSF